MSAKCGTSAAIDSGDWSLCRRKPERRAAREQRVALRLPLVEAHDHGP